MTKLMVPVNLSAFLLLLCSAAQAADVYYPGQAVENNTTPYYQPYATPPEWSQPTQGSNYPSQSQPYSSSGWTQSNQVPGTMRRGQQPAMNTPMPGRQPGTAPPRWPAGNNPPVGIMPSQQAAGQNSVITVNSVAMPSFVTLGGTVVPFKEVTLSAQVPGRIEYIAGTEGDSVEQGQVIVAIDDDELLAQRRQVMAELNTVQSDMRNAQVQYSRELISPQSRNINRAPGMGMPSLFDQFFTRGMGSTMGYGNPSMDRHADLYSSGTAVSQARARLLRAQSKLEEVDAKMRDSRSVAPFTGLIVKKLIEVGDTVQPGQPMINFADTKALQLAVDVPARLMPGIQSDMVVQAKLDVGDRIVTARVAQIFPMADVQRHTVTVKFDLPPDVAGGPGMYAEVILPDTSAPGREVMMIPATAVRWRGSLPAVFRMNKDNQAELRYVRLGENINPTTVTVLSGLHDGDHILVNPPANISSGWSPGQSQSR